MRNPWKVTSFALIALLAVGAANTAMVTADPQPKMRTALDHLRAAERSLETAAHDKGGHRAKALALTRQAIGQVKAGIRFDNRR